MKQKICKCGHSREAHSKHSLIFEDCDKCRCGNYLRRDKPHLVDKIFVVYCVVMLIVLWVTFGATWWMIVEFGGEEKIDMTFNEFGELMLIILFGLFLLFSVFIYPFIPEYFREKRRTIYPEDK